MKKGGFPSRTEIERFWQSMIALNGGRGFDTEEEKQACKTAVKTMYSFAGGQIASGTVWNWGLDMEEIDGCIRELLPSYDHIGSDGFSEQLYFFALRATGIADFTDRRLLDVGCGFGLGLNFISRAAQFRDIVGLDLCQEAINHADSRLGRQGMAFVCGDAENMPFGDGEMDVIINIESSHTYPDFERFLSEVNRVLRPGGCFSFVDVFTEERHRKFSEIKSHSDLNWVEEIDITEEVRSAIRKRLLRDSFLRRTLNSGSTTFGLKRLMEPLVLVNYGADFVDFEFSFMQRLFRKLVMRQISRATPFQDLKFTRYVHNMALKG